MLNLNDVRLFVAAVEHGGFAAAARALRAPKSTLSKRVAELEAALGARLVHRTSRSFTLTDAGRAFHEHARAALIEAEAAEDAVRKRAAEPSGTVRMTASIPASQLFLARVLPDFARAFPKVHVVVDVSDRFVDVVQEGFDIALRSHFSPLPDSGLVQRPLRAEDILLVAAPAYLKKHRVPRTPEDLRNHHGLLADPSVQTWRLNGPQHRSVEVAPVPRMAANESMVLLHAAVAGLGVVCLPAGMCAEALASGSLKRVLPDRTAGKVMETLVMPHRRGQLPAVRALVEFLVERA